MMMTYDSSLRAAICLARARSHPRPSIDSRIHQFQNHHRDRPTEVPLTRMWRSKLVRACSTAASSTASSAAASKPVSSSSSGNLYARLLERHPIKVKMLSSGFIMGSGDLSCQWLTKRHAEGEKQEGEGEAEAASTAAAATAEDAGYDLHRTAKFAFMGSIIIGPVLHHWYGFLVRTFPGTTTLATVKRLLVDQTVFAPIFIPVFFTGLQLLDGNFDVGDIKAKLEADYVDTLYANWRLWVPAMAINFRFVPTKYQVLYSNGVGFFWNIYLSFMSFKERPSEK